MEEKIEVKVQKVIEDPKLSLKMFSQYIGATDIRKLRILQGSKYPGDYIPKFYEKARKLICDLFSANFVDHDLYFDEFKLQAKILRDEAKEYPKNRDDFKNRSCSANGLDEVCAMANFLSPILKNYVLESNLSKRKDAIIRNGVRIGAMADLLVSDNVGITQIGFLKFNFTTKLLSKIEADTMLYVLKEFFERKGVKLNPKSCFLVDVYARRIYTLSGCKVMAENVDIATLEIRKNWDLI